MSLSYRLYIGPCGTVNLLLIMCLHLYILLYLGQSVMWPVWQSALLWQVFFQPDSRETFGLWSQWASALIVTAFLSAYGGAGGVGVFVNRENSMSRQRYSFCKSAKVCFYWVDANPFTFNSSFWQQRASSGWVSGWACWACWAQQAMTGIWLSQQVSGEPMWKPLNGSRQLRKKEEKREITTLKKEIWG